MIGEEILKIDEVLAKKIKAKVYVNEHISHENSLTHLTQNSEISDREHKGII